MPHELAEQLNASIEAANPHVLAMLSERGRRLYFPKGIIAQGKEAKEKATRVNATLGVATELGEPMHLKCMGVHFSGLDPSEIYSYAPPGGKPELRALWRDKALADNPRLQGKAMTLPMVTSALTHGLSLVGDLFVDPGDVVVLPDKLWGNYRLIFADRMMAETRTYPLYDSDSGLNTRAFEQALAQAAQERGKVIALMNFPNNPTGYTPTEDEMDSVAAAILRVADAGHNVVVVCDDAYFGLFYEHAAKESLFAYLAQQHPRVMPIRLDGATKEFFAWGFRIGFITYAPQAMPGRELAPLLDAFEAKTMGAIRGTISNCSMPAQSILCAALRSPDIAQQRQEKFAMVRDRAHKVKQVLDNPKYDAVWSCYPFNSGYFMCLRLKRADAERVRLRLLEDHGVGAIAVNPTDLRIAFSCLELDQIAGVFEAVYLAASAETSGG